MCGAPNAKLGAVAGVRGAQTCDGSGACCGARGRGGAGGGGCGWGTRTGGAGNGKRGALCEERGT